MREPIIFVSGLARCGSSLMMQMLSRGGLKCAGKFPYHEDDRTVSGGDASWLQDYDVVKWLLPHQHRLPAVDCRIIFMARDLKEQAKSTIKYMRAHGPRVAAQKGIDWSGVRREDVARRRKVLKAETPIALHNCRIAGPTLIVPFEQLIKNTNDWCYRIVNFLLRDELDPKAMRECLIRRETRCYPEMLETLLVAHGPRAEV